MAEDAAELALEAIDPFLNRREVQLLLLFDGPGPLTVSRCGKKQRARSRADFPTSRTQRALGARSKVTMSKLDIETQIYVIPGMGSKTGAKDSMKTKVGGRRISTPITQRQMRCRIAIKATDQARRDQKYSDGQALWIGATSRSITGDEGSVSLKSGFRWPLHYMLTI